MKKCWHGARTEKIWNIKNGVEAAELLKSRMEFAVVFVQSLCTLDYHKVNTGSLNLFSGWVERLSTPKVPTDWQNRQCIGYTMPCGNCFDGRDCCDTDTSICSLSLTSLFFYFWKHWQDGEARLVLIPLTHSSMSAVGLSLSLTYWLQKAGKVKRTWITNYQSLFSLT